MLKHCWTCYSVHWLLFSPFSADLLLSEAIFKTCSKFLFLVTPFQNVWLWSVPSGRGEELLPGHFFPLPLVPREGIHIKRETRPNLICFELRQGSPMYHEICFCVHLIKRTNLVLYGRAKKWLWNRVWLTLKSHWVLGRGHGKLLEGKIMIILRKWLSFEWLWLGNCITRQWVKWTQWIHLSKCICDSHEQKTPAKSVKKSPTLVCPQGLFPFFVHSRCLFGKETPRLNYTSPTTPHSCTHASTSENSITAHTTAHVSGVPIVLHPHY